MLILKLAFRNIVGAGVRTWLNVFVLSLAFVAIIWTQGLLEGMNKQVMDALIDMELGGGQFWHKAYDRYDPLTLDKAHGVPPDVVNHLIDNKKATPILIATGAVFPEGRVQSVLLKGIDPKQRIIHIPSGVLHSRDKEIIPALIGGRMAKETRLSPGDDATIRWRDIHGTFDAADIRIVSVMKTSVQSVDVNQIWLPIESLRAMMQAPGEATLVVLEKNILSVPTGDGAWVYRDTDYLLKDLREFIKTKSVGNAIMYVLLLFMALLAIFDTQVLSVFRRRKEIGTLMALGLPRGKVIGLFTVEGALHGILALALGTVYGVPVLMISAAKGLSLPKMMDNAGLAISDKLYPSYGAGLVVGTTLIVLAAVTIVSFLPTRKIADMNPTEALKGKRS
jgi:putative ABC transport system permease protein